MYTTEAEQKEVNHRLRCHDVSVTDKNEQIELLKQMAGHVVTHFKEVGG